MKHPLILRSPQSLTRNQPFIAKVLRLIHARYTATKKGAVQAEYLTVPQVAAILSVSEDTVLRQFREREDVIDLGTPETMHKRGKKMLRIPRHAVDRLLEEKRVKVRRK